MRMKQIVPHLWFDREAKEAAQFYTSLFDHSRIVSTTLLSDTPSGDAEAVSFELAGQPFEAISAGPIFKFNPSGSLTVLSTDVGEVKQLWQALSQGGTVLMELGEYAFNPCYGWLQDRYGLSWQLMQVETTVSQKIIPSLLFSGASNGMAEEAVNFYTTVFDNSRIDLVSHYTAGEAPSPKAKANYVSFSLLGQQLSAMDNAYDVDYGFNEAFSLMVYCDTQAQIDDYWAKLSHVPEAEACGWLKDRFGVSWQIVPRVMGEMMTNGTPEQIRRVTEAFLTMKKFDIETLTQAYEGR